MTAPTSPTRRALLGLAIAASLAVLAAPSCAHWNPPPQTVAQVDLLDRTNGTTLPVYAKDGRSYVVGTPGHEYAVRIRNTSGQRILAVTSVDGVNVVTGETASPDQSGYVIEPWGSVEIAGWRKSLQRTAAFYFAEHAQSYAARTGRPFDVGVIGVAVFVEKRAPAEQIGAGKPEARGRSDEAYPASAPPAPTAAGTSGFDAAAPMRDRREAASESKAAGAAAAPQLAAKLGTGHGRSETSYARHVAFERASSSPAQVVALQYDRYENLVAAGVIDAPPPRIAHSPRPFPGTRFVPDPR